MTSPPQALGVPQAYRERSTKTFREKEQLAIKVDNISKCYHIYAYPHDRLKQAIYPRLQGFLGRPCKTYYKEFWALKDISFAVKKGETIGIVGQNGSGKSTLLQIICGTLTATGGTVNANGRIAALLELGSGFNLEFTGRENVYMNGAVLGLSSDEITMRFDDIAAFADIGDFIEHPVKTYSSGMLVRLAFSVAINVDPQILVVDEALSVGDELFQRKCFSRIEAIKQKGATILFVSHSGSTIVELCDQAILLDGGDMLAMGKPKSIVGHYQKLIYAPLEKKEAIRDAILESDQCSLHSVAHFTESEADPTDCLKTDADGDAGNFFDPHLMPQSTMHYECHGACIESPEILTLSGERVNCLIRGERYRYRYLVRFSQAAACIRFGMLIKTTSGLELGGAVSAPDLGKAITHVTTGESVEVEFQFLCNLNPGTYFLNAGVTGILNDEETFLHRVLDIFMFRVMPIAGNSATAIVDFDCTVQTRLLTNELS